MELFRPEQVAGVFRGFREGGLEFHAELAIPYRSDLQWFLGGPAQTSYDVGPQLSHRSRDAFVEDLRSVWKNVAAFTTDDARLIVRFGAINDRPSDPMEVLETSLERTPWRLHRTVSAGTAARGRRQAVTFSSAPKAAALPEYDFWAVKAAA